MIKSKLTLVTGRIILSGLIVLSCTSNKDIATQINEYPLESLSADEIQSLSTMREEEKLAYDVYIASYSRWGVNIFANIAASENTHTEAVLTLIKKYNLTDPAANHTAGVFGDATLQGLYNKLVAQANISQLEALKVGATIEDLDIFDLNNWLKKVDNQDIKFVYDNLTKGSRNHMRSFYAQVVGAGGTYVAQYISQAEFNAIINSEKETGSW